jgi:predicted Zn-dependent protease
MRDKQDALATQEFQTLYKNAPHNASIETLAGQIKRLDKKDKDIPTFYRKALKQFPRHRALVYDYAELMLEERQYVNALKLLDYEVLLNGNDPKLYEMQARAYGPLGRHQEEHHVLSYYQILHGNLRGAIEQLELAKRAGNDYYQLSTIETELKQYREIIEAQRSKKK